MKQMHSRRDQRAVKRPLVLALLCGALTVLVLVSSACSRPSAERLNADGNKAFNRGEYPLALEDYRKAQVERPDLAAFNYNAGNVLHQQGDYPRAATESLRATQSGQSDVRVRAFYSVGADYYRQGKLKEAVDAYKSALRLDPNDLDAKYNLEVIQRRLDKEAEQRKALDQQTSQQQQDAQQQQQDGQPPQSGQGQQPTPQPQQGQQPSQPGQQPGQPSSQPQAGQPGQQQAGQPGQQPGQPQPGQAGQPSGQSQPDPNAQTGQPGQQGPPQAAGNQAGGSPSATTPGAQGTPAASTREQQAQLNQDLKNAIDAYNKSPSIEESLRILDILAEQERIAQAERGTGGDPRVRDK